MDKPPFERSMLAVGWTGTVASFLAQHVNVTISVVCAAAAFIASIYSILVSRAKLKTLAIEQKIDFLREERLRDFDMLRADLANSNGNGDTMSLPYRAKVLLVEDNTNDIFLIEKALKEKFDIETVTTLD